MVNGKQLTIVWHLDNLKISHINKNVVTQLIKDLDKVYRMDASGNETLPMVKRGKLHKYLRMLLDYLTPGNVRINMQDYIKKVLTLCQ